MGLLLRAVLLSMSFKKWHCEGSKAHTSRYGTIRTKLIGMLGPGYKHLLPAEVIGKGKSTIFEVRFRILKTPPQRLKAAVEKKLPGFFEDLQTVCSSSAKHGLAYIIGDQPARDAVISKDEDPMGIIMNQLPAPQNDCLGIRYDQWEESQKWQSNLRKPNSKNQNLQPIRESLRRRASSILRFSDWKFGSMRVPSIALEACLVLNMGMGQQISHRINPSLTDVRLSTHLNNERHSILLPPKPSMDEVIEASTNTEGEYGEMGHFGGLESISAMPRENFHPVVIEEVLVEEVLNRTLTYELELLKGSNDYFFEHENCISAEDFGFSFARHDWMMWIGDTYYGASAEPSLEELIFAVSQLSAEELLSFDQRGSTFLHSLIAWIDPRTMPSKPVRDVFRQLFSSIPQGSSFGGRENIRHMLDFRNQEGMTALHLAAKLALPHVVAELLAQEFRVLEVASAYPSIKKQEIAAKRAISVKDMYGTSLLEDLSHTYWLARASDEEHSLFLEADAMICVCLISDAMAGRLFRPNHPFRPLREWCTGTSRDETKKKSANIDHVVNELLN